MGNYTPAVIVHDMAPPRHEWPEWIRPLRTTSSADHQRLVVCDQMPRELVSTSHVDLDLWRWARRIVLDGVSTPKLARQCGVGARAIKKMLDCLRLERDVYASRRPRR